MYQLILIIPTSVDLQNFDQGWPYFLEAAEKMPGLVKESLTRIDRCLYGEGSITRIYTFSFPDQDTMTAALTSKSGEIAGQIIHALTGGKVILMTGEYREDTLDNIKFHNK
jgi:hypothetical protein